MQRLGGFLVMMTNQSHRCTFPYKINKRGLGVRRIQAYVIASSATVHRAQAAERVLYCALAPQGKSHAAEDLSLHQKSYSFALVSRRYGVAEARS